MKSLPLGLVLLLALLAAPGHAQGTAHVHGLATLDIAIEPGRLSLQLDAPQQALLGHERAPHSAAEREAAASLLARLRGASGLWQIEPALQCTLQGAEIEAPRLEASTSAAQADHDHADVNASYNYRCVGPGLLRRLDVGALFNAFAGITRIDARIAAPGGQHKASATRAAPRLQW